MQFDIPSGWYILAESRELKNKPLSRYLSGRPLVLFRDQYQQAAVALDSCPHRNAPLSDGKVIKGQIQCPYHGWEFDGTGACRVIPSLNPGDKIPQNAQLQAYPVKEQQGYIWVWMGQESPTTEPFLFPEKSQRSRGEGRLKVQIPNHYLNVIENFIDCPHTGYIHGGLFRSPADHSAETEVTAVEDGVIIDIDEEQKTNSFLGRILTRGHLEVTHQDRFIYPSIVQVAYTFGGRPITGYQVSTPSKEFETVVYVYVFWEMGPLNPIIQFFFPWIGRLILDQDYAILKRQGERIQELGESFHSVPADTANLWIRAAISRLSRGEAPPKERSKKVRFRL